MIASGLPATFGTTPPLAPDDRNPEARAASDARRLAWQREMERAQSEAWFRHAAPPTGDAPLPVVTARALGNETVEAQRRGAACGVATDGIGASRFAPGERPATAPTGDARAPSNESLGSDGPPSRASGATADDEAALTGGAAVPSGEAGRHVPSGPALASDPALATAAARGRASVDAAFLQPALRDRASADAAAVAFAPATPLPPSAPLGPPLASLASVAAGAPAPPATEDVFITQRTSLPGALREAAARATPMQLHVQWQGNEAQVWIGLSRAAASMPLPQLVRQLAASLGRSGFRLRSVVCNGVPCFDSTETAAPAPDLGATAIEPPRLDLHLTLSEAKD